MALAPFRRERAVKKILLVKALPLRVVLLYRTAGWNARLFRKSLCKRLCKSLKTLSSAGGRPFRRSSGAPLEASQALPGPGIFAMTWRGSAAVWRRGDCRGLPAETKGDRTPMVSCPLLTLLTFLCAATPFGCAAKRGLRGLGSVRRAGFGRLLCPEVSLRNLPRITVRGHPVQGANAVSAKSSASINGVLLEYQTPLWAPRI